MAEGTQALRAMRNAAREALIDIAFDLAGRSAADAPVETGRLRGSVSPGGDPAYGGSEEPLVVEVGDRIEVEVSFSAPYAAVQHEGYIDYGSGTEVHRAASKMTLPSGKVIDVGPYTQTRTGRVYFRHHPLGGKKKYLEDNLKAMVPRYERMIAERVRLAIEHIGD